MYQFKRLQEQAYDYIKEQIFSGGFEEARVYSETQVAKEIGISRTPVRDAIQRLNQEGIVDIFPSKGFALHRLSAEDVIETYQIRSALESYCARLMTHECSCARAKSCLAQMEALIERQAEIQAAKAGDIALFAEHDQSFHSLLIGYAQNKTFDEIFKNQMYRIKTLTVNSLSHPGRMQDTIKEHRQIHRAISSGDLRGCSDMAIEHLDNLKELVLQLLDSSRREKMA